MSGAAVSLCLSVCLSVLSIAYVLCMPMSDRAAPACCLPGAKLR